MLARDYSLFYYSNTQQLEAVQMIDARVILMASRALAKVARTPKDYFDVYKTILSNCDYPVILHWLGDMFDPQLFGYWSATNFEDSLEVVLEIIEENERKVDGIKISLLDQRLIPPDYYGQICFFLAVALYLLASNYIKDINVVCA